MKKLHLVAAATAAMALFAGGLLTGIALGGADATAEAGVKVLLDNARVTVKEITMAPGARRPPRTRGSDEVVLFPEEAHYQAIDADGKKQPRDRLPGAVVFHTKGELAPTLVNISARPVHYFSVGIK